MKTLALITLLIGALTVMTDLAFDSGTPQQYPYSPQFQDGKFNNPVKTNVFSWRKMANFLRSYITERSSDTTPKRAIPVMPLTAGALQQAGNGTLYRLGHSTILMKLHNEFWLTDPVFSERASPLQWLGPKRFHPAPINIEDLPPIKAVIISHDHYDHLDKASILKLANKVEHFLTPLGVGDLLITWGIDSNKVQQFDWWQSTRIADVKVVATPAQHFSGRGLNGNQTLWASWVISSKQQNIFFSGDTGYFDGFKKIGERYGPFDITLMETGAYHQNWSDIHMLPEHTLQAHFDLNGKQLLPIHNGTFDLALHAWYDPFEKITALSQQTGVKLLLPKMGEAVSLEPKSYATAAAKNNSWWQNTLYAQNL